MSTGATSELFHRDRGAALDEKQRVDRGLALARALIATLASELEDKTYVEDSPVLEKTVLRAVLGRNPDGSDEQIPAPLIPLLDTTLLTNSPGEPHVGHQLQTEIVSASQIDFNDASLERLVSALLVEISEEWETGKIYISMESGEA